jgi:hypothetical protein
METTPFVWQGLGKGEANVMNAAGEERASEFANYIELDIITS